MKKILFLFMLILAMVSCKTDHTIEPTILEQTVCFNIESKTISMENFSPSRKATNASIPLTKTSFTDLFVFEGNKLLAHKKKGDADFANPAITLAIGEHSLTFIGRKDGNSTFSNGTWTTNKVASTFGCILNINVGASTSQQAVLLDRLNVEIGWKPSDKVPSTVDTVIIGLEKYYPSLDSQLNGANLISPYSEYKSKTIAAGADIAIAVFPQYCNIEDSITTTFAALNKNKDTIYYHVMRVPILTNHRTVISGELYKNATSSISIKEEWLNGYEINL